jgi:hypothetical protein
MGTHKSYGQEQCSEFEFWGPEEGLWIPNMLSISILQEIVEILENLCIDSLLI